MIEKLISLPANFAEMFHEVEKERRAPEWFATHDPVGKKLGSGGGTAYLLEQAWKKQGEERSFEEWTRSPRKILIHGGGESRRLPAYAPFGKLFMPLPVPPWNQGAHIERKLVDLQLPILEELFERGDGNYCCLVASGDVLNCFNPDSLENIPKADVLCLGAGGEPKIASRHGVFLSRKDSPERLERVLQKPSLEKLKEIETKGYRFLIDVGIWLLSPKALELLMRKCGWNADKQSFTDGFPRKYCVYSDFGTALGADAIKKDTETNALSAAVLPLHNTAFLHFGSSRDIIRSTHALQTMTPDQDNPIASTKKKHPSIFTQNSSVEYRFSNANKNIWVENSTIPASWTLKTAHILTNVPENDWKISPPEGTCLDFPILLDGSICARPYGIDDTFSGPLAEARFMNKPLSNWLAERGLSTSDMTNGIHDIYHARLFPLFQSTESMETIVQWMIEEHPTDLKETMRKQYLGIPKISAAEIAERADITRIVKNRNKAMARRLLATAKNNGDNTFHNKDLKQAASIFSESGIPLPPPLHNDHPASILARDAMFRAEFFRLSGNPDSEKWKEKAFSILRGEVAEALASDIPLPKSDILPDQIVWGRSPARLDLAGGWTDTPPYCFDHGGQVLNLAANLNGQPPIQAFAKLSDESKLTLRSIDLGCEIRVETYGELETYEEIGDAFSIPKAALTLAGFSKRSGFPSLKKQLENFGGGMELTMMVAVPKGSGLGTSSILAATVLGVLNQTASLGWDKYDISRETIALEQLLTTGGGWQDQIGGIFKGVKFATTAPGLEQRPNIEWLPDSIPQSPDFQRRSLLYYTGITRIAKNILGEIVRSMFLNSGEHLRILNRIGETAEYAADAARKGDLEALAEALRGSWSLNQRLDPGTNPPPVRKIIERISKRASAVKLLGAGGGGYMLILAKSQDDTLEIKRALEKNPPNDKARFVDFSLSDTGLEVTKS